ncbi:hypothetical protein ES703_36060 [subsurface metagenome]
MNDSSFKIEDVLGSRAKVKILKELAKAEELSISLLIKRTKLNYSIVNKHLKQLTSLDLVQEKKFGRIRIFRYKIENPKARSFRTLIDIWEGI